MRYPAVDSLAGGDPDQLARGGDNGGLRLPERIFDERMRDDKTHLVVHAIEAAERVEHAVAPQELIGGGRQLVAIGAELQFRLRTMFLQIASDDAILQHSPEGDAGASWRPC